MVIKKPSDIKSSEITDKKVYLNRRLFMSGAVLAASTVATGFLYKKLLAPEIELPTPTGKTAPGSQVASKQWGLPGWEATCYQDNTQYVAFETANDPKARGIPETDALSWPYVEGLRLDEAMNPLALLSTGIYGEPLLPQNGAPIRLVVPWKYGFKSIKSVVRIKLIERMPTTTWVAEVPDVYGFFSTVNPGVDVLRDQSSEQRIGEWGRRKTQAFNGYADQVAHMYDGMDLSYYH